MLLEVVQDLMANLRAGHVRQESTVDVGEETVKTDGVDAYLTPDVAQVFEQFSSMDFKQARLKVRIYVLQDELVNDSKDFRTIDLVTDLGDFRMTFHEVFGGGYGRGITSQISDKFAYEHSLDVLLHLTEHSSFTHF